MVIRLIDSFVKQRKRRAFTEFPMRGFRTGYFITDFPGGVGTMNHAHSRSTGNPATKTTTKND